jgi:hypothetical protein
MIDFIGAINHLRFGIANTDLVVKTFLDRDEDEFVNRGAENTTSFLMKVRRKICTSTKKTDPKGRLYDDQKMPR